MQKKHTAAGEEVAHRSLAASLTMYETGLLSARPCSVRISIWYIHGHLNNTPVYVTALPGQAGPPPVRHYQSSR